MLDEARIRKRKVKDVMKKIEKKSGSNRIFSDSNRIFIRGIIEDEFQYSHEIYGKKFYRTRVRVKRYNGEEDLIPILVSDFLIEKEMHNKLLKGKWVEAVGEFRSFNKSGEDGRSHLILFLFTNFINICENEEELKNVTSENLIYLDGYLCKPPVFRKTPLEKNITDLLIAVNRTNGKSDYIPCIVWGELARWAKKFEVRNRVTICGRVQSRIYFKKCPNDPQIGELRQVYEVSVMTMQKVGD